MSVKRSIMISGVLIIFIFGNKVFSKSILQNKCLLIEDIFFFNSIVELYLGSNFFYKIA
jgi:hypothetical protein